jgi:hypothetical protein
MNMSRLQWIALVRIEKELEPLIPEDNGHKYLATLGSAPESLPIALGA